MVLKLKTTIQEVYGSDAKGTLHKIYNSFHLNKYRSSKHPCYRSFIVIAFHINVCIWFRILKFSNPNHTQHINKFRFPISPQLPQAFKTPMKVIMSGERPPFCSCLKEVKLHDLGYAEYT